MLVNEWFLEWFLALYYHIYLFLSGGKDTECNYSLDPSDPKDDSSEVIKESHLLLHTHTHIIISWNTFSASEKGARALEGLSSYLIGCRNVELGENWQ